MKKKYGNIIISYKDDISVEVIAIYTKYELDEDISLYYKLLNSVTEQSKINNLSKLIKFIEANKIDLYYLIDKYENKDKNYTITLYENVTVDIINKHSLLFLGESVEVKESLPLRDSNMNDFNRSEMMTY